MAKDVEAWNPKKIWHRFWILAVSLSTATGKEIAPIFPALHKAFSNYPVTLIKMNSANQLFLLVIAVILIDFSHPLAGTYLFNTIANHVLK